MKRFLARLTLATFLFQSVVASALGYTHNYTVPAAGGCPVPNHQDIGSAAPPLLRQWSTSLPNTIPPAILTVAAPGTSAQLTEIESAVSDSYGMWSGVSGTLLNAANFPNALAPLGRTPVQNACTNDVLSNADGINTICFNQSSAAFTTGVLSFTRLIIADAPAQSFGSAPPSVFPGQIVDADIFIRNDGQATFATPGALITTAGAGAYDLESILGHELGHIFGLDHSGVWRSIMFPFAPPPGTFLGDRPTSSAPDAPLADDDRVGLRSLYPDPADTLDAGFISGRILPANPFALAILPATATHEYVTGIFGGQIVAVDDTTGSVVASTIGGWTCDPSNPPARFDGSYTIGPLPVGRSYLLYVEPFVGIVSPNDIAGGLFTLCGSPASPACTVPAIITNFNPRFRPGP
ncbi:MAG TPA: matrixin family metalloprotease [Candidatus Acidoferrales bacterium]|nr:matrixin family metalloprotease [Candidatus Acidoferrales bacterium]